MFSFIGMQHVSSFPNKLMKITFTNIEENKLGRCGDPLGPKLHEFWNFSKKLTQIPPGRRTPEYCTHLKNQGSLFSQPCIIGSVRGQFWGNIIYNTMPLFNMIECLYFFDSTNFFRLRQKFGKYFCCCFFEKLKTPKFHF